MGEGVDDRTEVLDIYIATWGNPLGWRKATYLCSESEEQKERKGFTSSVCWGKGLRILYVVDSVITAQVITAQGPGQDERAASEVARECANVRGVKIMQKSDHGEQKQVVVTFDPVEKVEWRDAVVEYIKCVSKVLGLEVDEVAVGAAKGEYIAGGKKWVFEAHKEVLAVSMLGELWKAIQRVLQRKLDASDNQNLRQINLHIDVTHGVNFVPALMASVARMLASLLLSRVSDSVVIKLYNAVPTAENRYEYVKVYTEEVRRFYFPWEPKTPGVTALYYGALLQLVQECRDFKKKREALPTPREVENREGANIVKYEGGKTYQDLKLLYEDLLIEEVCGSAKEAMGGDCISLKFLQKWSIRRKLTPTAEVILIRELDTIYNAISKVEGGQSLEGKKIGQLLDYYVKESDSDCACEKRNTLRNFIAHAGLLKDCIEICKTEDCWGLKADKATSNCLNN